MNKSEILKYSKKINGSDNDKKFFSRVWSTNESIYLNRIKAINFKNYENVLDAGCGFGQWSFPLARINTNVFAIDYSKTRINLCKEINQKLAYKNLYFSVGSVENINFPSSNFNAIFAYGVLMTTNWKKTIREFSRVLKKNGRLYLTANEIGWYLNILINNYNQAKGYNTKESFTKTLINTEKFNKNENIKIKEGHIIIKIKDLILECKKNDLKLITYADEGKILLNSKIKKNKSFFKGNYYGYPGCYEIIFKKL
ncbi:class I SAM-dependent methyltransferase [Alphaproteobacteria bacterium]|nr:class I SAM-dependent methyltransferase [Alphaproteobacteria bacterium]